MFGAAKEPGYEVPPEPAVLMRIVIACVDGTIRDVLAANVARRLAEWRRSNMLLLRQPGPSTGYLGLDQKPGALASIRTPKAWS